MSPSSFSRTVLVVEDHALTLTLLCESLRSAGFIVTGVGSATDALDLFDDVDPDVLLTDINLGGPVSGVDVAVALKARAPYLALVLLSNYATDSANPDGFRLPAGAAFVSKNDLASTDELLQVIEAVLHDEAVPDHGPEPANPLRRLTRKQLRILQRMAQGWSNAEIARREGLTPAAVEKLITRIFAGLDMHPSRQVNPRVLAVRLYLQSVGFPPAAVPSEAESVTST